MLWSVQHGEELGLDFLQQRQNKNQESFLSIYRVLHISVMLCLKLHCSCARENYFADCASLHGEHLTVPAF